MTACMAASPTAESAAFAIAVERHRVHTRPALNNRLRLTQHEGWERVGVLRHLTATHHLHLPLVAISD